MAVPQNACFACGAIARQCLNLQDKQLKPEPGDTWICIVCGTIGVFGPNLEIQKPTKEQIDRIRHDPEVLEHSIAVQLMHALIVGRDGHA